MIILESARLLEREDLQFSIEKNTQKYYKKVSYIYLKVLKSAYDSRVLWLRKKNIKG